MAEHRELNLDNFEQAVQDYLIQGVVVGVEGERVDFVATHVHEGRDEVIDNRVYRQYRTTSQLSPWFSELPESYRSLWDESQRDIIPDAERFHDSVDVQDGLELQPGDTIHIHETTFWEPIPGTRGKTGYPKIDVCKLPIPNPGLDVMLSAILQERAERLAQALQSMEVEEQANMLELDRLSSGESLRAFTDPGVHDAANKHYQTVGSRFVFGEGEVSDHFVQVSARTALQSEVELGGIRRFGVDGSQYLVPSILPLGMGTSDDPLYEVKIHIHSQTKLNPAVSELRPVVIIDGLRYVALVNTEESSSGFIAPGHDMVFSGFRQEDSGPDMVGLTDEQIAAINGRSKRETSISLRKLHENVDQGVDFIAEMDRIDEEAEAEIEAQRKQYEEEQAVIDSILGNPREYTISTGASILVPRSMLDALEIRFDS